MKAQHDITPYFDLEFDCPLYLIDFYKVGHVSQYVKGLKRVYSNYTPRYTNVKGVDRVVFFGLQYFIKEILVRQWNKNFFDQPLEKVIADYRKVIAATLGVTNAKTDHIEKLHQLGYLPLDIYALPEGVSVRHGVPVLVITNTHDDFFWLPNYFETILSNIIWKPMTSATTAQRFRGIFTKWAKAAGEKDLSFIDWQGHDFSYRGMSGKEDAILSGMGHLAAFNGTDTVPAIIAAHNYYGADLSCGGSVPATEHSVMCAGGQENELETFRRLIEDVYPSGIVSIVSDTWDLWKVLTEYIPALKDKILARPGIGEYIPGKIVIRPDSGDPVNIMCGDPNAALNRMHDGHLESNPPFLGTLRCLSNAMGIVPGGGDLPMINKAGTIYGDGISPQRAEDILRRTVEELKLSPYNVVFGIGSYTYEYVTRDTHGQAMKATAVDLGNGVQAIFKKPVTDDGGKTSHKGIPAVYENDFADFEVFETVDATALDNCAFQKKYSNGKLLVDEKFDTIRKRVRHEIN